MKTTSRSIPTPESYYDETVCVVCKRKIRRGDPRCAIMFAELGIGPGHPEFSEAALREDTEMSSRHDGSQRSLGLIESKGVIAMCGPCSGENPIIEIVNPWWYEREQRAADDPGGSVHIIPLSQMNGIYRDGDYEENEIFDDHNDGLPQGEGGSPAHNEAQDRFISERSGEPAIARLTENDRRERMSIFMRAHPSAMHGKLKRVCELWAQGKIQNEIARELGDSQATVCNLIRRGKALVR